MPWAEHARWSPDCTYLRRSRGFGFTVEFGEQRGSSSLNGASAPRKDTENGGRKDGLKRTENSTPTQNSKVTTNEAMDQIKKDLLNMGFDRQKVEMAILKHENNGDNFDIFGRTFLEHKIGNLPYESSVRQRKFFNSVRYIGHGSVYLSSYKHVSSFYQT